MIDERSLSSGSVQRWTSHISMCTHGVFRLTRASVSVTGFRPKPTPAACLPVLRPPLFEDRTPSVLFRRNSGSTTDPFDGTATTTRLSAASIPSIRSLRFVYSVQRPCHTRCSRGLRPSTPRGTVSPGAASRYRPGSKLTLAGRPGAVTTPCRRSLFQFPGWF